MRGLGIVGAATPLRPGSGAQNTSQVPFSPACQSVDTAGPSAWLACRWPPAGVGGEGLATGNGKRRSPFGTGVRGDRLRLGRHPPRASLGRAPSRLRPRRQRLLAARLGTAGDDPAFPEMTHCEARSQGLPFIALSRDRLCTPPSAGPAASPSPPPAATSWVSPQGVARQLLVVPAVLRRLLPHVQALAPSVIVGDSR